MFSIEAHRSFVRQADLLRLADQEWKVLPQHESRRALKIAGDRVTREAVDEVLAADDRKRYAHVLVRVTNQPLRLTATGHRVGVLQDSLAHRDDAAVALPAMLLRPIGDGPLSHPRDEVLVHDVRGDPSPGLRILDRARPVRDAILRERLHVVRHSIEEPADRERGLVVDRDAPLEVPAGEETVRPETRAPDRPQRVLV